MKPLINKNYRQNKTIDGKLIFPGDIIFKLRSALGLPLMISIEFCYSNNIEISWFDFINEARKNKWKDDKILKEIEYNLRDSGTDINKINIIMLKIIEYINK